MFVLSSSGHANAKALLSRACTKPMYKQVQSIPTLKATLSYDILKLQERRSANYHPTIWNPTQIQSLSTEYTYDLYGERLEELKQDAGRLITSTRDFVAQLKIIDQLQRLGVAYHFEQEIMDIITLEGPKASGDLEADSLHFRLLRQTGLPVASGNCPTLICLNEIVA